MSKKVDFGSEVSDTGKMFGTFLVDHFIQLVVVGVSATQTFFLVSQIAPNWATWLPLLGVLLMEGGYLFWMWREFTADIADGSLKDIEKNAQEKIANRMVYITLGLSVLTMLAGGLIEIAQSDLLAVLAVPQFASLVGLIAISSIFVLAGIHLFADWRYRRADPDVAIDRVHRMKMRQMRRRQQEAILGGEEKVTEEEVIHTQELYTANKRTLGQTRAKEEFTGRYENTFAADDEQISLKQPTTRQNGNGDKGFTNRQS
jgi:hypothetical protein